VKKAPKPTHKKPERVDLVRQRSNQDRFLRQFIECGTVRTACELVGIHWSTHYGWLKTDKEYSLRFGEAELLYADGVRDEVHRRGLQGWDEPVIFQGKPSTIGRGKKKRPVTIRKYSDRLLELLARAKCPEFRETKEGGKGDGGIAPQELAAKLQAGRDRLAKRNPRS
jgi:hypothetical protein